MKKSYSELLRFSVEALGVETSYYLAGAPDKPPLLLLHGMSTSADSFRELMHELADDFFLVAPDIPGFGYSANTAPYTLPHLVEWLASFADGLEQASLHVLGHSFGGTLAAAYAAAYPEDVSHLVLLAPAILSANQYPDWLKKTGSALGFLELGTALSRLFLQRRIRVPFYDPARQPESLWQRRLADYDNARASADVLKASAFYDLRPQLGRVEQKTCIIWGKNDPVVKPDDATALVQMMPQAEAHLLDECGHAPMLERREQVVDIMRGFLP